MKQTTTTETNTPGLSLEERKEQLISQIAFVADHLPAVVIIHNYQQNMRVEYMSTRGYEYLKTTLEEIRALGEDYHKRFFNPDDAPEYIEKLTHLLNGENDEEIKSLFQQVRSSEKEPWSWYFTTLKILMRDDEGNVLLTIGLAHPVDTLHHVTAKVSRLLDENNFLRLNVHRYSRLSARERQVLQHIALGKTASESASELFISVTTVETHRRNIKKKLEASSFFDLSQYARAFDLI